MLSLVIGKVWGEAYGDGRMSAGGFSWMLFVSYIITRFSLTPETTDPSVHFCFIQKVI
jgi:hypothetical protein